MSRVRVRFDAAGEVVAFELAPSDEECRRGWQALMLAPDPEDDPDSLEICRALVGGESVPIDKLHPEWVARFGRRPR